MARTVPSWSWTTWAIFARVPTGVELRRRLDVLLLGVALGDERDGPALGDAAFRALTDFSRPTWSGTIISGKMTVSRRATSGSSRGPLVLVVVG
jgi:hypothetical protein